MSPLKNKRLKWSINKEQIITSIASIKPSQTWTLLVDIHDVWSWPLKLYWTKDLFHKSVLFVGLCRSSTVPMLNVCFKMNQIWEKTSLSHTEGGSWPQISTHGPRPQNHLRCRYCVRSHASPPSWSPSSLEFESGSELGMPQGGENCRFRGWPLKIAQSFPSPNINIGSLQEEGHCTSSGQHWPNYLFFSSGKIEQNTLFMVHVCAEFPRESL